MSRCALLVSVVFAFAGCVGDAPEFTDCPAGLLPCQGNCIDPLADWGHCGATDCDSAATAGTACPETGYCSEGECRESDGPFVSPGNPEDGATVRHPREATFQISYAEPRRVRYTTDGSAPQPGNASTVEADAPVSVKVSPGSQLRWYALGDRAERLLIVERGETAEAGSIAENIAFARSGSATIVALPGERLALSGLMRCWAPSSGARTSCGAKFVSSSGNYGICGATAELYPGIYGPLSFEILVPPAPGVYYVRGFVDSGECTANASPNGGAVARVIVR